MKILFVSPGILYSKKYPFERAGSESQIYGVSKEMVKQGHEVYVTGRFYDFNGKDIKIIDGINFVNIRTPHLRDEHIHQIGSSLLYSKAVAKKIKQINPDVITLNERFSAYFPSKLDIPKIFVTHNPDAMAFYKDFALKYNRLNHIFFNVKKNIEKSVMVRSDTIVALTRGIRDYLQENGFTNIDIIPNAVNAEKYTNSGDENYILFAGRLNKVKGIQYLIEAFSELINEFDSDLLIVGSGLDEIRLKKIVTSKSMEDRVHFTQTVRKNELRDLMSKCSAFVLPSLFESFGIVIIEAMASGKPVIASNILGPQDIISQGYDGFLFETENVDELKKHLKLCISDKKLREKIGYNARKTVEERYTFDKTANLYLKVYGNLLCKQKK